MLEPTEPDPVEEPAARRPEPIRRSLRVACGVLGAILVALALAAAAAEPNPWLSLPPLGIGALLLVPAFGARPAACDLETEEALERALELAQAARSLLVPGLLGLLVAHLLERSEPHFSLEGDVVGSVTAALIAALLLAGTGCAVGAIYQRARALGR